MLEQIEEILHIPSIDNSTVIVTIPIEVEPSLTLFEVQDMLAKQLAPVIVKELRRSGVNVDMSMFELLYRPSLNAVLIQGGNPVRITIGHHIASMNTNDYYAMLKRHISYVPKHWRSVALVRKSSIETIDGKFKRHIETVTGVDVDEIPLMLKTFEYSITEHCMVIAKHRETGIEVRLLMDIKDSIKCRETAKIKLSEEVLRKRMNDKRNA